MRRDKLALALALSLSVTTVCAVDMQTQAATLDTKEDLMGKCATLNVQAQEAVAQLTKISEDLEAGVRTAEEVYDEVCEIVNSFAGASNTLKEEIITACSEIAGASISLPKLNTYLDGTQGFWMPSEGNAYYSELKQGTLTADTFADYENAKAAYEADPSQENYGRLACAMAELAERLKFDSWEGLSSNSKKPLQVSSTFDAETNVVTTVAHMDYQYLDVEKLNVEHIFAMATFDKELVRTFTVEGTDLSSMRITQNEKQYTSTDNNYESVRPGIAMYTEGDNFVMSHEMPCPIAGQPTVNEDGTITVLIDNQADVEGDEIAAVFYEYWNGRFTGSAAVTELDQVVEQVASLSSMLEVVEEFNTIVNTYLHDSNVSSLGYTHTEMFKNQNLNKYKEAVAAQKERCTKVRTSNEYFKLAKEMLRYNYLVSTGDLLDDQDFRLINRTKGIMSAVCTNHNDVCYYQYKMDSDDNMTLKKLSGLYTTADNAVQYQLGGTKVYVDGGQNWHNVIGSPVFNADGSITVTYKEYLRLRKATLQPAKDVNVFCYDAGNNQEPVVFTLLAGNKKVTYLNKWGLSCDSTATLDNSGSMWWGIKASFNYNGKTISASFSDANRGSGFPEELSVADCM